MYKYLVVFTIVLASVGAASSPFNNERIVGGELTTIEQYPFQSALLLVNSWDLSRSVYLCGGTVLNARSILTAAHCFVYGVNPSGYRLRVGSTYANSGGIEHNVAQIILNPAYKAITLDNDVAIVRTASIIVYNDQVQPATIAGPGYNLPDNDPVWAVGWGRTSYDGELSEELRHVQVYTVNQALCRVRFMGMNEVTNNMLCSGVIDVGGKDQCYGDSGGPLVHNGVVVGVCSWGEECALASHPGVNARVSRFTNWIQANIS